MSDTIARMAAMRARNVLANDAGVDRLANLDNFGSNPGALRARIYVPNDLPSNAPLVVVLHGCTQTAAAYDHGSGWSQLADRHGFALLYPEQQRANNPNLCFNWFVPGDTMRDSGEALSIRQMIDTLAAVRNIDPKRIFVTGLSAGGAMATAMLAAYPELFAGGAIIAGLPYGTAATIPEAFDRMRGHGIPGDAELQARVRKASTWKGPWPTLSVWQGTADQTVVPSNADAIVGQWLGLHGLGRNPALAETVDGQQRRVWRDADGGDVVEAYTIAGMAHGVPLAPGLDGIGRAGPYMLDVGISSTERIGAFWDIAARAETRTGKPRIAQPRAGELVSTGENKLARPQRPAKTGKTADAGKSSGVGKIIEDALRAAGLMR